MAINYTFKVIVVGADNIGKNTLVNCRDRKYQYHHLSIGVNFSSMTVSLSNDFACKLQIWNVLALERYMFLHPYYYRGASGCLLLFDRSDRYTFEGLEDWLKRIRNYEPNLPIVLVGTKSDLDYLVSEDEMKDYIHEYGLDGYFLYSKYESDKREILFSQFTKILVRNHETPTDRMFFNNISENELSNELKALRLERAQKNIQSAIELREKLQKFIDFFSECPICKKRNHHGPLHGFYYNPNKFKLKKSLIRFMEESEDFESLYNNNITLGIPCCTCFKKVFN